MEEQVGELWHKLITRVSDNQHPQAVVHLHDVQKPLAIFFRALGGDSGLQIEVADATTNHARRTLLQRIAGSQAKIQLAWLDERSLKLPASIAWFDSTALNTDLYFWLACLATVQAKSLSSTHFSERPAENQQNWFVQNQQTTQQVLQQYTGVNSRYQRLLQAHLAQRPDSRDSNIDDAEQAIQQALKSPGSIDSLPTSKFPPQAVPLWLHPDPPLAVTAEYDHNDDNQTMTNTQSRELDDIGRRQAERVVDPESNRGLITVRMENIFTMGEFVNVDRGSEDEDDIDRAEDIARNLDRLSVTKNGSAAKTRLKFDLDLPSAEADDTVIDDGILLPEWDWKKQRLLPNRCRIVQLQTDDATPCVLPSHLGRTAKKLRNKFQTMAPARVWHRAQTEGQDIDLDAYIRYMSERAAGNDLAAENLYRDMRSGARDLSCLLLADLSLSTDAHINDRHRIIDVIRDSLYLFAESLYATGDRFSLLGFSSRRRDPIRIHNIKAFNESYNAVIRGRIEAIKLGYYTRLGAGIRYATQRLSKEGNGRRLLLILTDGKPNDLDQYEGRYGIEDTRQAVVTAKQLGMLPFCITIDKKANDYLPYLFGKNNYAVIHQPEKLPKALPQLYSQLTQ